MSRLQSLRAAGKLEDVAVLLGFTPSGLSYILYKIPNDAKYTAFDIPKRDGTKRHIKAPEDRLRLAQRRLANLLYECLAEIEKDNSGRKSLSHGFAKGRSIITNASLHKRRRYVLNLDLENFFPSFNFGRVRGFFIKDKYFTLSEKAATVIAQIACHNNELPQGSPCSPIISNLIGHVLDARLARLAKTCKCTYSRYADDITFSTGRRNFPSELAAPDPTNLIKWNLGKELVSRILDSGFKLNHKKTRMQFKGSRQVVTGLLVNEKVNVTPEYYKTVRAMCHSIFMTGSYSFKLPALGEDSKTPKVIKSSNLSALAGRLAHIDHVRNGLQRKHRKEFEGKKGLQKREAQDKSSAKGFYKLYRDFLFYKNFIALGKPLLLPEGKTDTMYIQCAVRYSPNFHPALGKSEQSGFKYSLRFMTYSLTVHEYLQLGGGFGDLTSFISTYKKRAQAFKHKPMKYPVIILVDNDDGGKQTFGPANKAGAKPEVSINSKDPFYHVGFNLYIIKTPELGADSKSCMEDLFDDSVKNTTIDGKVFDPAKDHEEPGKYGKYIFAERVVRPNASMIDFSKFELLLSRIEAVFMHYKAQQDSTIAA